MEQIWKKWGAKEEAGWPVGSGSCWWIALIIKLIALNDKLVERVSPPLAPEPLQEKEGRNIYVQRYTHHSFVFWCDI